jgi:hypothetical protein
MQCLLRCKDASWTCSSVCWRITIGWTAGCKQSSRENQQTVEASRLVRRLLHGQVIWYASTCRRRANVLFAAWKSFGGGQHHLLDKPFFTFDREKPIGLSHPPPTPRWGRRGTIIKDLLRLSLKLWLSRGQLHAQRKWLNLVIMVFVPFNFAQRPGKTNFRNDP